MPAIEVDAEASFQIVSQWGKFQVLTFKGLDASLPPLFALQKGDPRSVARPLVRVQSSCITGEVLGSKYCDCADQLHTAMRLVDSSRTGLIIYLHQEARGNGELAKFRIYSWMQAHPLSSSDDACEELGYPIDRRTYENAAAVLHCLGVFRIRLLTNNPDKEAALRAYGIDLERENLRVQVTEYNKAYLLDKQRRHRHDLGLEDSADLWRELAVAGS